MNRTTETGDVHDDDMKSKGCTHHDIRSRPTSCTVTCIQPPLGTQDTLQVQNTKSRDSCPIPSQAPFLRSLRRRNPKCRVICDIFNFIRFSRDSFSVPWNTSMESHQLFAFDRPERSRRLSFPNTRGSGTSFQKPLLHALDRRPTFLASNQ